MVLAIEIIVFIAAFTAIVVPLTLKDPLASLGSYPPAIRERCVELGLVEAGRPRFTKREVAKKVCACVLLVLVLALLLSRVNGDATFAEGFRDALAIWLAITWYDALVLDCGWFCHSKRVMIPGTEDMPAYKDYGFHLRASLFGTVLGMPACALVGLLVALL